VFIGSLGAPTAIGGEVRAETVLEIVESRQLTFRVAQSDARGLVAAWRTAGVVVDGARFLEKAAGGGV